MSSYLEARKAFGLSREKLSNLAKLAGVRVSPASIKKLEDEGEKAVGSRGLSPDAVSYIDYVLGIGTFEPTNWSTVEKGAPVIVSGEKGTYSFVKAEGSTVSVFSDKFRDFDTSRVRLVAPTALPAESTAHLFETRTRGDGGYYARQVMSYIEAHADMPHSVGALAYSLGLENSVVSRTVAQLVKGGKLTKAGRGVVTLGGAPAPAEAPLAEATEAASTASVSEASEEIPSF